MNKINKTALYLHNYDLFKTPVVSPSDIAEIDYDALYADLNQFIAQQIALFPILATNFGKLRNTDALNSVIERVQNAHEDYLYSSVEGRAVGIMYNIIKSHPFADGNKRIGSFVFLWYLNFHNSKYAENISPELIASFAIMMASSNDLDAEHLKSLIVTLLICQ